MKFRITLICCLALLLAGFSLSAQRDCGSMEYLELQQQQDPKRIAKMEAIEKFTNEYVESAQKVDGVITIPVVVHVVYRTSTENISEAQINSQMQVLNDDFRRMNSDADGTWSQAQDSEIEFCLATVDPQGNPTNGITRTPTSVNGFGTNDAVKFNSSGGKDAWPASDYLNVWVCNIGGGILGYAQFPGGSPSTDGVVNGYQYFGTTGTATAPFNLGRTMTHEVGHYLNLRHIWGDGNCNADDFVSDTPTSDAPNYGCATGHVSCNSTDMVQNYMDYSDDACMNLFTAGQNVRMRALFDTGGFRESLLNSPACGAPADPTCDDGIQNGNETGIDCGGDCATCPTCDDGIQNGDETGVDCGGSACQTCPCDGTDVTVTINLDNYPEETSWTLTDASGATVGSGGTYGSQPDGSTVSESFCLPDGCYDFTINDSYGDGICCGYGNGSYSVTGGGSTLASGGSFGSTETTNFCVGGGDPTPTCDDGIQNGDETGVDCGGSDCAPCASCDDGIQNQGETGIDCGGPCTACPTCDDGIQNGGETGVDCGGPDCAPCGGGECTDVTIDSNNFNSWGIWNDGGSDCRRSSRDAQFANTGNFCVRLRDNSGVASSMFTDNLNLDGFEEVTIDFNFLPNSMENGEDLILEASVNGGSSWIYITNWVSGSDFFNGTREFVAVTMTGDFTSATRFRLRCDASGNNDQVYVDDVLLTGCTTGNFVPGGNPQEEVVITEDFRAPAPITLEGISNLNLFPNPASSAVTVTYDLAVDGYVQTMITDMNGKVIRMNDAYAERGMQTTKFDISDWNPGIYLLQVVSADSRKMTKFVVVK